ncbi:MAG: FxsA family protein [Gammaproteobacteria bacterium]
MPLFRLLLILFFTVPLIEIYLLIQVGGLVGVMPTIGLCVLTAIIGAWLLRLQGLQTLARVQRRLEHGEMPATDLLEGLILLMCGALLLTPGFFTDTIGFLCLVPKIRRYIATSFLNRMFLRGTQYTVHHSVTLDGEYWEEDQNRFLH